MSAFEHTAVDDDLLVWAFLADLPDVSSLPWLVLREPHGPLGPERFAVPRLILEPDWSSEQSRITLDDVPISPGESPSRSQQPELIVDMLALDIERLTGRQLLERGRPKLAAGRIGRLEKETAARNLRRRRAQMRAYAARAGALPWAAFELGDPPPRWREHPRFLAALEQWQVEAIPAAREAALFCIGMASREWSGLPPADHHWGEARARGPRYKTPASRTIKEYVHVGPHAVILSSGRPVGPGDIVQPTELTSEDQWLLDESFLVDVDAFAPDPVGGVSGDDSAPTLSGGNGYLTEEPFGFSALKLARRRLEVSARAAPEPSQDDWIERLLREPGESRNQTDSYMSALDRCHALDELRAAWSHMRPVAGSAGPRCP